MCTREIDFTKSILQNRFEKVESFSGTLAVHFEKNKKYPPINNYDRTSVIHVIVEVILLKIPERVFLVKPNRCIAVSPRPWFI